MNTLKQKLRPSFEPETRFDVDAVPAPFRGAQPVEIEFLKDKLLRQALQATAKGEHYAPLRRAANEAAALAWLTPFPLLLLPGLFEELARKAKEQSEQQSRVLKRSHKLMRVAA
ncbi:MAG TPA: hypothetical protein VGE41_13130 [Verrucomicrobiae bacterium]|jgi:hypothetical protein